MRKYTLGLGALVAVFAGSYVFIYLYRWEWNRALMSAALFLVAEVALVGAVIVERMRRIDAKLDARTNAYTATQPSAGSVGGALIGAADDEYAAPTDRQPAASGTVDFPWLRASGEPTDRFGVFIPVLMGAGVVLSGIAWLVERIARAAAPRAGGEAARNRPSVLALPPGGPFAEDTTTAPATSGGSGWRPGRAVAVTVGALALVGPGVFWLADLTQSRPDPPEVAVASAVTIEASSNLPWTERSNHKVDARWHFCSDENYPVLSPSGLHKVGQQQFVGIVTPALGDRAERRFVGCLQDAAVDTILLRVTEVEAVGESD